MMESVMRTALIGLVRLLLEADLLGGKLLCLMYGALERGREGLDVLGGGPDVAQDCRGVSRQYV